MDKIKLILKEELKKESDQYLIESIEPLSNIKDRDVLIENLTGVVIDLIDKGYSMEEISLVVEQNTAVAPAVVNQETGKVNLLDSIFGGTKSAFIEQLIKWLLQATGIAEGEKLSQGMAIFISQYPNPFNLLRLFKNPQYCSEEATKLVPALLEIVVNNWQFDGQKQDPLGKGFLKIEIRNAIADAVRQSTLDDVIGVKLCNYIWKNKIEKG